MIRFIFVCMAVVAVTTAVMLTRPVTGDISAAQQDVVARNAAPEEVQPAAQAASDEISFEEIYANAKAPEATGEAFFSPEELNAIDTTAGGNEFSDGFTDTAPKALSEKPAAVTETEAQ